MTEQTFDVSRESHSTVGRSRFPPIAEYGFISDCEVCALVAPSGSAEWMCLPRKDGPSILAAVLDRHAGADIREASFGKASVFLTHATEPVVDL